MLFSLSLQRPSHLSFLLFSVLLLLHFPSPTQILSFRSLEEYVLVSLICISLVSFTLNSYSFGLLFNHVSSSPPPDLQSFLSFQSLVIIVLLVFFVFRNLFPFFSLLDTLPSPFLMSKRSFDRHLLRTQETEFKVKVGFFSSLKLFFVYLFFAYFFFVGDRTKSESTPSSSFLFLCFKKIRQRKRRLARSRVDRNKRRKEAEREGKKGVQKKKATRSKRSREGSKTTACEGSQSFFLAIKEP